MTRSPVTALRLCRKGGRMGNSREPYEGCVRPAGPAVTPAGRVAKLSTLVIFVDEKKRERAAIVTRVHPEIPGCLDLYVFPNKEAMAIGLKVNIREGHDEEMWHFPT
jgi:hypothetical protein